MIIDNAKLLEFIEKEYNGDYKAFAEAVGVHSTTVYRIIKGRTIPGERFISLFYVYCKRKGIDFGHYFFCE